MIKICEECGVEFETNNSRRKLCSENCRRIRGNRRARERYNEEYRVKPINKEKKETKKKPKGLTIEQINKMAMKHHMSYGQYVALHHL